MDDFPMMPVSPAGIYVFILLIWLNGIFYGFSAAIGNLKEADIEKRALTGEKKALRILKLLARPGQYANAVPLLVISSGICFGAGVLPYLFLHFPRFKEHFLALGILLVISLILLSSLGIVTFRRIGTYQSERFAFRYVNIVYYFCRFFSPFTLAIGLMARMAARPFGVDFDQAEAAVTEEEIISMVDEAHEQGVIEENEAEMIQNIISFNETQAHDIMTHRKSIIGFEQSSLLQEVVETMLEEGNSRYPVYENSIDNIVGVVHYKDALKFFTKNSWANFKPLKELPGLIRDAALIPETRSIGDLFRFMQKRKIHMAIVVDEYGQTAGLVSMEDILEEIVGDIMDEYDEEEASFRLMSGGSLVIDALTRLDDVEEELGISFGDVAFETLNGYLTSCLGHIPTTADMDKEITACGYRFTILSLGNKIIGKVRAQKLEA
ncbi:MAG: HlyC/CorC family transporter [Blautia sp.]|nr:HlyC/CorC family transporter [Blautia sp.]